MLKIVKTGVLAGITALEPFTPLGERKTWSHSWLDLNVLSSVSFYLAGSSYMVVVLSFEY
jgi:hypothetical protein